MKITPRCKNDLFCSLPWALILDPTMIVTIVANPGKEHATRKGDFHKGTVPLELKDCDQLTVTSGCCTRAARTMTANCTESKSPSFQLADNLCEAPFTDPREKTSFADDSLSG